MAKPPKEQLTSRLSLIGNAIREKSGGTDKLTIPQMNSTLKGLNFKSGVMCGQQEYALSSGATVNVSITFPRPINLSKAMMIGFLSIPSSYAGSRGYTGRFYIGYKNVDSYYIKNKYVAFSGYVSNSVNKNNILTSTGIHLNLTFKADSQTPSKFLITWVCGEDK